MRYSALSIIIFLAILVGMGSLIPLNVSTATISNATLSEERYVG
jgi:hypothetical protein